MDWPSFWFGWVLGAASWYVAVHSLYWLATWIERRRYRRNMAAIRRGAPASMKDGEYGVFHPFDGNCPDCNGNVWIEGPSGGMNVNIKCAGCGLWLNHCPPLRMAERLGKR